MVLFILLSGSKAFSSETIPKKEPREYVVLLHGLARSSNSMLLLQKALEKEGYGTCNIDYPSTEHTIEYLSNTYLSKELDTCVPKDARRIHFVAHSMGGILIRYYLKHNKMKHLGRVVMLSPPNAGTEVVDKLGDTYFFKKLNGPAITQLGTGADSLPNQLGPVNFELGILTGSRTINPILSAMIPGKDDGKVSIKRAKVEGMSDFMVVPHSHPFIMRSAEVARQTAYFLKHGKFLRDSEKNKEAMEPK